MKFSRLVTKNMFNSDYLTPVVFLICTYTSVSIIFFLFFSGQFREWLCSRTNIKACISFLVLVTGHWAELHVDLPSATSSSMAPLTWEKHHCTSLFPPPVPAPNTFQVITNPPEKKSSHALAWSYVSYKHKYNKQAPQDVKLVVRFGCAYCIHTQGVAYREGKLVFP